MDTFCILKYLIVMNHILEIGGSPFLTYENDIYGQIKSPGYPGNYPNNANYTWIIRTGHQKANVIVNITMMSIEKWSPCDDYLLIREIDPCCLNAFKRCGDMEGKMVYARGMEIQVSFISDHRKTAKGFDLTWTVTLPATTPIPKTTLITAKKVDLTPTTPITTTITPRRNVRTTQLLYTSSTNPIRSTAPRENLKSTTLLHKSTLTKPIRTTAQREKLKSTALLRKSTLTKPIRTTTQREKLKSTTLLRKSTSTKSSRTTAQRENLKSTTLPHEPKQFQTSTHVALRTTIFTSTTEFNGVSKSSRKQQSVTTTTAIQRITHSTQTKKHSLTSSHTTTTTSSSSSSSSSTAPRETMIYTTSGTFSTVIHGVTRGGENNAIDESGVYLISGVGAILLLVSIFVTCFAVRCQKDNKKIQERRQKDTNKRENQTLVSMHIYSSPTYETIPADIISPYEATGDYARVNDQKFTWYAAQNMSDSDHMTRVDSISNGTDVYHTLEPNARFTEPSPLLQRNSNVYHTLEMRSFLQPE